MRKQISAAKLNSVRIQGRFISLIVHSKTPKTSRTIIAIFIIKSPLVCKCFPSLLDYIISRNLGFVKLRICEIERAALTHTVGKVIDNGDLRDTC